MSGIIRKIDELGRIVIPKEIRKFLNIEEGSTLSIDVIEDKICLTKFYPLRRISEHINNIAQVIFESIGLGVIITDEKCVLSCAGVSEREFLGKELSEYFIANIKSQKCCYNLDIYNIIPNQNSVFMSMCCVPVFDGPKAVGSIVLLDKTPNKQIGESSIALTKCMANYITKFLD